MNTTATKQERRARGKIAFIASNFSSFVRQDCEILSNYYDVETVTFAGIQEDIIAGVTSFLKIVNAVRVSDISCTWFANDSAFFAVTASKIFRKKSIVIIGGGDVANEPEIGYGRYTEDILRRQMTTLVLKYADVLLPVSQFTHHETESRTKNNIKMVYNGIDLNNFAPHGTKEELVLTVGHDIKQKGIDTFVGAAHHLPNKTFMIVGMPEDSITDLQRHCNIPDNLILVGNVPYADMVEYYQRAKVYCQLSYRESFGMALAEAMACGCIPVVTDRGAMPEVVGNMGYYVNYGDVDATVTAIKEAFGDLDTQPRKQIADKFSISRRATALKNIVDFNLKDAGTRNRLQKSVRLANIQSGERVLDLGCNDSAIKALFPDDVMYIGVDMDVGDVKCNLEDGIPAQLQGMKFDIIFLNEFIEHIENFKSLLIQCRDLLSENGRIIISTPSPSRVLFGEDPTHIHCFRKSNMRNLANICGMQVDKIIGTHLGIPYIPMIPLSQTLLTEVIICKLTVIGVTCK